MRQRKSKIRGLGVVVLAALLLTACAGRNAVPVSRQQYGDDKKSCEHLKVELSELQGEIAVKTNTVDKVNGGNMALAVFGGLFFFPAWFFMDLSKADQVELEALCKRHNALVRLCADHNCGYDYKEIAPLGQAQAEVRLDSPMPGTDGGNSVATSATPTPVSAPVSVSAAPVAAQPSVSAAPEPGK